MSKNERKALKEIQSDISIVILPAGKGRSTGILNHEDYLEKFMDHINNDRYQLLNKGRVALWFATCARNPKVPGSSPAVTYV